jgi:hypothetical protein
VVTVFGRGTGRTKVIVVSVAGQKEYEVRVEAAIAPRVAAAGRSGTRGLIESRIETAVPQIHTTVDVAREEGKRRTVRLRAYLHAGA